MIERKRALWLSLIVSQGVFFALMPIWKNLFNYLHPIVIFVVWICLTLFILFLGLLMTKNTLTITKSIFSMLLTIFTICLVVLLFLRPLNQNYNTFNLVPFKTITSYLSGNFSFYIAFYNLAANIFLFVPYGIFALMMRKNRISKIKKYGLPIVVIMFIEILQFITKRGSMDIDDLILNVLGIYLGYLLTPLIKKVFMIRSINRDLYDSNTCKFAHLDFYKMNKN